MNRSFHYASVLADRWRQTVFVPCRSLICVTVVMLFLAHQQSGRAAERPAGQKKSQPEVTNEFLDCDPLPPEIRERAALAQKAEQDSKWTEALTLRQEIKAACEKKYGADDLQSIEADWRLSLVK